MKSSEIRIGVRQQLKAVWSLAVHLENTRLPRNSGKGRNCLRHEGHLLSGKTRVMVAGAVNMGVMSGWARQPLPQLIALLRIMTHPQPIPAHGHLLLHLLIFHVAKWVFATHTHARPPAHARTHSRCPLNKQTSTPNDVLTRPHT